MWPCARQPSVSEMTCGTSSRRRRPRRASAPRSSCVTRRSCGSAMISGRRGDREARSRCRIWPPARSAAGRPPTPAPCHTRSRSPRSAAGDRTAGLARRGAFDRITRLAAQLLNAPVALVSLVDDDRPVLQGRIGTEGAVEERPRDAAVALVLSAHAADARAADRRGRRTHPLVRDNLAIRDLEVVAYAGVPLITAEGHVLGTLCVIDHQPRLWTERSDRNPRGAHRLGHERDGTRHRKAAA